MRTKTLVAALSVSASLNAWGATADPALIAKGEYVAQAGDCVACHTVKGGKPFAGGLPLETPIGMIYSTNITPDIKTGIGSYAFEDFDKAVRQGIRKDGSTLYPAMPFPSYARVSDEDMRALYAYFQSGVAAVSQPNRAVDIPWPLSIRWPLAYWRWMFAPQVSSVVPLKGDDPLRARGAYLVEGLGHCGTCHTPRAVTLQEKALSDDASGRFLSGGAPIEGWIAKDLRGSSVTGLGRWTEQDIVAFLQTGRNDHTAVFGGMSDVVVHSLQHLSEPDLRAIAHYLKSLPAGDPNEKPLATTTDDTASKLHDLKVENLGGRVYADNCMACHRSDGMGYAQTFPGLARNAVLSDPAADSIIRIVLIGHTVPATEQAVTAYTMPAFGWRLSDEEVAAVTTFIRQAWGNTGTNVTAEAVSSVRSTLSTDTLNGARGALPAGAVEARLSK
jgi:mono/diheme cytochrome c family protein